MSEDFTKVINRARKKPLLVPGETTKEVQIGKAEIQRMLPHRDPLLLVDRIDAVDLEQKALRAFRKIDPADPVMKGHFPDYPVYPGALLVEAMGQASLCLFHLMRHGRAEVLADDKPLPVRLLRIHHALFQAEVRPGDQVEMQCLLLEDDSYTVTCAAQARVGDKICALTVMDVFLADDDE